jgi:kynurenine formamidase
MGMTLMHNLSTAKLVSRTNQLSRSDFLFTLAPLKIPGATGSPANPLAIL